MKNHITIGMDLGDKFHIAVVFDQEGNELEISKLTNTKARTPSASFSNDYSDPRR
jgi:transposase